MTSASCNNISRLLKLLSAFLLGLSVILGVQGCSSGGSSAPVVPVDSDPVGYFTGSAILDTTTITSPDMVGLAYDNRIMIFNMAENVLLDITLTDITLTDFTGTVDVYIDGNIQGAGGTTVAGTTNNSQIEGTFTFAADAGFTAGSFDILLDMNTNLGATIERANVGGAFSGQYGGIDNDTLGAFSVDSLGSYTFADSFVELCRADDDVVIPDLTINIYRLSHDVVSQASGTCNVTYESTGHTGFASVISTTNPDDTAVFAFANGTFALYAAGLTR